MKRHSNSYKTWPKTSFLQNHYFTTEHFARRVKTLAVASWHLLTRRVRLLAIASDDRQLYEQASVFTKKPNFDNPNLKIDRKRYLLLFYNLDINFFTLIQGITYTFNNLIEFKT